MRIILCASSSFYVFGDMSLLWAKDNTSGEVNKLWLNSFLFGYY